MSEPRPGADAAHLEPATLAELERVAVAAATEAGRLIVDERPRDLTVAQTKSTITDVVTVMDQRSQDLLRERLAAARPHDGFYGEEQGGHEGRSGVTWVVDPIDGTVNYLYDIPAYAVSVAAVVGDPHTPGGWHPVAGAVVNPVSGELFHARRGGGAWRTRGRHDARVVQAGQTDRLDLALVGTGFGYDPRRRRWQADVLRHLLTRVRDIRRIGSAALDLCHVADGSLDAYYERGLNPWDFAAAWLVATEAGARVTGRGAGVPSADLVVAAGPRLHAGLLDLVAAAEAEAGVEDEQPRG